LADENGGVRKAIKVTRLATIPASVYVKGEFVGGPVTSSPMMHAGELDALVFAIKSVAFDKEAAAKSTRSTRRTGFTVFRSRIAPERIGGAFF